MMLRKEHVMLRKGTNNAWDGIYSMMLRRDHVMLRKEHVMLMRGTNDARDVIYDAEEGRNSAAKDGVQQGRDITFFPCRTLSFTYSQSQNQLTGLLHSESVKEREA